MACHTPPLKKVKKQGEVLLPSLGPIPLKNVEFRYGMGWDCKTRSANAFHKQVSHLVHLAVFLTNTFPNREFP